MAIVNDDGLIAAFVGGYCEAQRGKPYRWAASGPDAFDCSGLVWAGYKYAHDNGASYPDPGVRWTTYTIAVMGDGVEIGREQPGDLILPSPGHVGVCVGNGMMINAPSDGIPVREDQYGRPWMIRRLNTPTSNGAIATVAAAVQMGSGLPKVGKDLGGAFGDTVNAAGGALGEVTRSVRAMMDVFGSLGKIAAWLSNSKNWVRIGTFLLGAVVLFLGLRAVTGMVA